MLNKSPKYFRFLSILTCYLINEFKSNCMKTAPLWTNNSDLGLRSRRIQLLGLLTSLGGKEVQLSSRLNIFTLTIERISVKFVYHRKQPHPHSLGKIQVATKKGFHGMQLNVSRALHPKSSSFSLFSTGVSKLYFFLRILRSVSLALSFCNC